MSAQQSFPLHWAEEAIAPIFSRIEALSERAAIVGSVRRRRPFVKDVEILYVPKLKPALRTPFEEALDPRPAPLVNHVDIFLESLIENGVIAKRRNVKNSTMWGQENKFAVLLPRDLPIDFFSTDLPRWWNALVVRTGGKVSNINICESARRRGWKFEPYGMGFKKFGSREYHATTSERDVFEFVGLPFLPPNQRK